MKQKKKSAKTRQKDLLKRVINLGIHAAIFLVIAILVMNVSKQLYRFGYEFFAEQPGTGVEISVEFTVAVGESAASVAGRLKDKGLISSEATFLLQKAVYDKDIYAGVHTLHSNMTTLEILGVLSSPAESVE